MNGMSSDDMVKASEQAKSQQGTFKAQQEYNYNVRLAPLGPWPRASRVPRASPLALTATVTLVGGWRGAAGLRHGRSKTRGIWRAPSYAHA